MTWTALLLASLLAGALAPLGHAQTPADILAAFERAARKGDPAFGGFSAARGEAFFRSTHGAQWSCASCHTAAPVQAGRHARTGKTISPLAPSADAARFTDAAKVEKWFKRNCNDVAGRNCTLTEKGDVLTWLNSLHP